MKNKISILVFLSFFSLTIKAQVASSLGISNTRSINDLPNLSSHSIRADFKLRDVIGVPGLGYYSTNLTIAQWSDTDNSGDKNHQLNFNNGGIFYRNAYPLDSQWGAWQQILMTNENGNVGIGTSNANTKLEVIGDEPNVLEIAGFYNSRMYGNVNDKSETRINLGKLEGSVREPMGAIGAFPSNNTTSLYGNLTFYTRENNSIIERVRINSNGNVGIGTNSPDTKLAVNGTIHSKEVKVDMNGWSDFVFKKEYNLPTLEDVEKHITEKGHLENIPSEKEVLKDGINLGEMNAKLLQKIEELTLYMIAQNKQLKIQNEQLLLQNKEIQLLKNK